MKNWQNIGLKIMIAIILFAIGLGSLWLKSYLTGVDFWTLFWLQL